jgi:hypothetical protein
MKELTELQEKYDALKTEYHLIRAALRQCLSNEQNVANPGSIDKIQFLKNGQATEAGASENFMEKISESDIQETCSQMLELDDWRRVRTDMKQLRGMGVQEPGMADDLYLRYMVMIPVFVGNGSDFAAMCEAMWIEWKRLKGGAKPTKAGNRQRDWHRLERRRGALTLIAGEDFPASIEGFRDFYKTSGLMRRKILS